MNPRETSIKHSALGWVKKSIDDNLSEIETDLKLYIEEEDEALLERVKERLSVIQGVLMMIEQYGAAMLTEEMVALVEFITENRQEQREPSLEVLLRAVLQLPDYLEHIQSGHRDIPIAILPLLNDIRAVRNQDLFSEKLLFLPDLSMHEQGAEVQAIDEKQNQASKMLAKKLRPVYQLALVNIIKEQQVEESLKRLEKVCEILEERAVSEQIARIWWIVGALIESVQRQQLELGVSIKNLLGKVDALFRVILIIGERGLAMRQPVELIKNFLFYVAQPECDGPKTQAIKTAYRLEQFLPSEAARSEVLDNIAGPNQALLKTVAEAMKADIEAVKSAFEVYVNGDLSKVEVLKDLPQEMHIISDTLAMIGLGLQRQLIEAQIDVVRNIVEGRKAADEEQLLSMAAELIQVEQALDQMQKRQPVSAEKPKSESDVSRDYELDNVLTAVVTAALDDIQKTKNALLEFIKDSSRVENIELCLTLMKESRGALELLNQQRAVAVVDGLMKYLRGYEIEAFMDSSRLDALSQVVASLEYYLEALGEHRGDADGILDFADVQLQDLLASLPAAKPQAADMPGLAVVPDAPEASTPETVVGEAPPPQTGIAAEAGVAPAAETAEPAATEIAPQAGPAEAEVAPEAGPAEAEIELEAEPAEAEVAPEAGPVEAEIELEAEPAEFEVALEAEPVEAEIELEVEPVEAEIEPVETEIALEAGPEEPEIATEAIVAREIRPIAEQGEVSQTPAARFDAGLDESAAVEGDADGAPAVALQVTPVDEMPEVLKPGSDPDILDIYLEEAEEESQNIKRLQQDWLLHPEDENALKNIRRAFHTIKGSGRLVGAMKIGEFAWDYEQLLNRLIDKTIKPSRQIIDAVGQASQALPELVNELKTAEPPQSDIGYLRGLARALAEFRAEQLIVDPAGSQTAAESPDDRITNGDEPEWQDIAVEATMKITPPDGIREALLEEIEPDTMQVAPAAFEVDRIAEAGPTGAESPDADDTVQAPSPEDAGAVEAGEDAAASALGAADFEFEESESEYTQAIDYAQEPEAGAAGGIEEIEALDLEYVEPVSEEEIKIETVGEDFLDEDFDELADGEFSLDPASMPGEFESDDELPILEVDETDIEPPTAEIDIEPTGDEIDIEQPGDEIDIEPPAAEIDIEPPAAEFEIEPPVAEIDIEPPTAEIEIDPAAAEIEAIDVDETETGLEAMPPEADEIEPPAAADSAQDDAPPLDTAMVGMALEASGIDAEVKTSSEEPTPAAEAPQSPATASHKAGGSEATKEEGPPDPLAGMTRSRVPGEEAGVGEPRDHVPAEPTGLSFDPELLIIYQQEVEQHLGILNSALNRAEKIRELIPGEDIYRALHTIHGASRTADIATIGELAGLMEKPLKSAIAQKMALDHEIVALYREGQHAIHRMTEELVASRQLPAIPEDLGVSFRALAEDFEEHTVELPGEESETTGEFIDTLTMMNEAAEEQQDNELLTIFIDEANELLEMSDNTLHEWAEQQTDDSGAFDYSAVMELQRYLHTLKGGARMAEINEISDLSHEMESMFIAVIDGRVDKNENLIELLKDCFDLLHQQVAEAQEGQELADSSGLVQMLRNLRLEEGDETVIETTESGIDVDSEDIDIVAENLPGEPLASAERNQDVIKVRADLLDNLVSSAGEVSIYRARMEQQVAGLGSYLGELGQTISRLKGQLRNLEAETDAQIHYSHRAEAGRSDFDPLEMDHYTMIQELSRSLSESVNDLSSLQNMLGEQVKDSETLLLQQSRVSTDLQDGLIKSRMVKFSGLLSRLRRLVRQSSQELGKKAELVITGEQNEVDNKVLDRMVAPLEHIIRNALSHGIETPVERVKKGKPESGKIEIDITRDGSEVVIRVGDDGAGVNLEKVRSRAIQLGLLDRSHNISDSDLVQYILEPGFSTADHVTQLSGRGVGMDVVDIEIKQLGGTLQIETTPQGTTFIARLPFTLSINQAILVRTGDETYAIPLINIEGITRLDAQSMVEYYRQEAPELEYAGQRFALHSLAKLVDTSSHFRGTAETEKQPVIMSRSGDLRIALHVDEIIGNREIVVKTLGKQLSQVKGLAGASILADGSVVLILDINGLIRQSAASAVKIVYQPEQEDLAKGRNTVMVVDDSITMRRVASKLLERHNYEVVTAKDGVDALAQLQDVQPDVMLLDIEMPRMDGFELATHMQNEENYSRIPIIMITSRTGEKHRDRAFEIGVTNYMGKPYQEEELIENIQSALVR